MMTASLWLSLIEAPAPGHRRGLSAGPSPRGRTDGDFCTLDAAAFAACPSDSIDYAVMEHIAGERSAGDTRALVLPLNVGWSDVGAWSALWEVRDQDAAGNVLDGDAFVHDAHNNLLMAKSRMLAAVGVDDLIVVETPDAVLVTRKDRAQDVKAVTQYLQREQRMEHRHHQKVHRPWGDFEGIGHGPRYQVKRLTVKPGESLSLQMHHHRAEHWVVVSGTARVTCDDKNFLLTENQSTYIPVGAKHRLENPGTLTLEIIEVQSGELPGRGRHRPLRGRLPAQFHRHLIALTRGPRHGRTNPRPPSPVPRPVSTPWSPPPARPGRSASAATATRPSSSIPGSAGAAPAPSPTPTCAS